MKHIINEGYAGIYKLDGIELRSGQKIKIAWPDGSETMHELKIEHREEEYGDMGHTYNTILHVPVIAINVRGHYMKVDLIKLDGFRHVKIEFFGGLNEA